MSTKVIADVSETLITLLRNNMGGLVQDPQKEIVLLSPGELQEKKVRLTLFLYSMVENSFLKNDRRPIEDPGKTRFVPLSLDLHYILSTYTPNVNIPDPALEAMKVLGKAMQIFYDNGIISGSVLQGDLPKNNAKLRITLHPISIEDLTRIWSVFPNIAYCSSVGYLVTPARIESERIFKAKRVTSKQTDSDHLVPQNGE